jgi:hypothetical protein
MESQLWHLMLLLSIRKMRCYSEWNGSLVSDDSVLCLEVPTLEMEFQKSAGCFVLNNTLPRMLIIILATSSDFWNFFKYTLHLNLILLKIYVQLMNYIKVEPYPCKSLWRPISL